MVVAGYANDFAGYVTTWHEYQTQQYEGGHTLFGPWTEAAYRQEFARLARALKTGETVTPAVHPTDMRTVPHRNVSLDGPDEQAPKNAQLRRYCHLAARKVYRGRCGQGVILDRQPRQRIRPP